MSQTRKKKSKRIGKGSYGEIYRPYIPCKEGTAPPDYDFTNKVSKLGSNLDDEYEIYKIFEKYDKNNELHPGPVILCNVKEETAKKIGLRKPYGNLVMEDGGIPFNVFGAEINYDLEVIVNRIELYYLEAHRLFRIIMFQNDHNILHKDFKGENENFVYDENRNRVNIIDYGLAIVKSNSSPYVRLRHIVGSLGQFSLLPILKKLKPETAEKIEEFITKYFTVDDDEYTNEEIITAYETLLRKTGILGKYHVKIDSNHVMHKHVDFSDMILSWKQKQEYDKAMRKQEREELYRELGETPPSSPGYYAGKKNTKITRSRKYKKK